MNQYERRPRPASQRATRTTDAKSGISFIGLARRLAVQKPTLKGHRGCVNSLSWNSEGTRLLSGSDDCTVKLWDPYRNDHAGSALVHSFATSHTANIFSAKFMVGSDTKIASCAMNGKVRYLETNGASVSLNGLFNCHSEMTDEVFPDPQNPHVFFSCSDDGTVNEYDTRVATSCHCEHCNKYTIIDVNRSVSSHPYARLDNLAKHRGVPKTTTSASSAPGDVRRLGLRRFFSSGGTGIAAISLHPVHSQYMALGCSDDVVRVFDRRLLKPPGTIDWSNDIAASRGEVYSAIPAKFVPYALSEEDRKQYLPVWPSHIPRPTPRIVFDPKKITSCKFDPSGLTLDILVSYSGDKVYLLRPYEGSVDFETPASNPPYTLSNVGKLTSIASEMINRIKSDRSVVNCVCPNPSQDMIAVSGIDHDIKLLQPTNEIPWDSSNSNNVVADDDEESDDDYEDDNLGPIPRDLLLAFLARHGLTVGDVLGGMAAHQDDLEVDGDEDEEEDEDGRNKWR
ncbi:WD40 repeat-like protein [Rhizoclosmatium globosum]|uniref:WD40 repeat-like protein n=1 Tax=Rhizoclosmatium globosum TaxID=329046 RepID=A0A1Y2CWW7_9FUNG|nr:WD40 repeat-like protein [Rhizoclosmatium globosum]|eukprot:ORY51531.1 WD40 repeat-like protein [Rhizoclosmatium globosum]